MAIRRVAAADLAVIRDYWNQYRSLPEYAREQGWTVEQVREMLANPRYYIAVDIDARTLGVFIQHGDRFEVSLLISLRSGAQGRRNADAMLAYGAQMAANEGCVVIYGSYLFPPGVDALSTAAVRYFGSFAAANVAAEAREDGTAVIIEGKVADLLADSRLREA